MQLRVARVVEQDAAGELAVASRAPRLLIVGLRRRRQGPVHHQPDRRLVDAHAEGAGGDDQIEAVVQEIIEDGGAPGPVRPAWYGAARWPARRTARAIDSVSPRVGA